MAIDYRKQIVASALKYVGTQEPKGFTQREKKDAGREELPERQWNMSFQCTPTRYLKTAINGGHPGTAQVGMNPSRNESDIVVSVIRIRVEHGFIENLDRRKDLFLDVPHVLEYLLVGRREIRPFTGRAGSICRECLKRTRT